MVASRRSWAEPFKIKMVEPIHMTTREQRETAIQAAGYNTFLLAIRGRLHRPAHRLGHVGDVRRQWAGMMVGDEAYAGSRNFYHLVDAVARCLRVLRAGPDAPGARRRAHPQPDPDQDGRRHPRQHVLHHDTLPPGAARAAASST